MHELFFFITVLIDLTVILLMAYLGRSALMATVVVNILLVSTFGAKLIPIFGFVTNSANVFYASIFLAVNILIERYGTSEGRKAVRIGLISLVLFMVMSQFVLFTAGSGMMQTFDDAIKTVFRIAPRIAFASMVAYVVAQHLNIWLYDILRRKSGGQLWLRNISGTCVAQFVDSILFFFLAFYGTIPDEVLVQTILTGFMIKVAVALISTPFLYAGVRVPRMDLSATDQGTAYDVPVLGHQKTTLTIDASTAWTVKIISILSVACGILVMGGWVFDISILTTGFPGIPISMKFSAAASFVFSGIILHFISEHLQERKDLSSVVLPIAVLLIVLFMMTLFISVVFGIRTGIEDMFTQELPASGVIVPGQPAVATMICFLLIATAGMLTLAHTHTLQSQLRILGSIIGLVGLTAVTGHITGVPTLYFLIGTVSNGMALHTSILFSCIGYGLFLLGRRKHVQHTTG